MHTILVIDSDTGQRAETVQAIEASGVEIIEASSSEEAQRLIRQRPISLILIDIVLRDMTAAGLLRTLRDAGHRDLGVVVLSKWTSEADRVVALEQGFDDFVPRPYSASELSARVRAMLRRIRDPAGPDPARTVPRTPPAARLASQRVEWALEPTPKERRLVEELLQRSGHVVSRRELLKAVWGPQTDRTERVVDAHVKAIRRKLGGDRYRLETVRGLGYRMREPYSEAS